MAPDGRSFLTACRWRMSPRDSRCIWRSADFAGGNTADPKFSRDGAILLTASSNALRMSADSWRRLGEIWTMDLRSGRTQRVVSGMQVIDYDISADGQQLVIETAAPGGKPQL